MKRLRKLTFIWLIALAVGIVGILLIPREYQAKTSLLPVEQKSASALAGLDGAVVASFLGRAASSTPSSVIVSILGSETIELEVLSHPEIIEKLLRDEDQIKAMKNGDPLWFRSILPALTKRLESLVTVVNNSQGPIVIDVVTGDPDLSANIANRYVEDLRVILKARTSTQTQRKREFTENLVVEKRHQLDLLRKKMLNFDPDGNIQNLSPQLLPLIEELSDLERKKASLQMQHDFLAKYQSEDSGVTIALEKQIKELSHKIAVVRDTSKNKTFQLGQGGAIRPSGKIPLIALEYQVTLAEMKVLEDVVSALERELEMLKIEEVSDEISFQVLDEAKPTDNPIYPRRKQLAILWFILISTIAGLYLFRRERIIGIYEQVVQAVKRILSD